MTFVGGSITTFGESGGLETDCWATDSAHLVVLSWLRLDPTFFISSATDPVSLELPLVSSSFRRLCSSYWSAFFLSFSWARSCCRKCSSSSCCCIFRRNSFSCCCSNSCSRCCCSCCKRNSSCWRRSSISSRSCYNSNSRSRSRCSVSFLAVWFLSSISLFCRLLDDRELAILVCFLRPCVAECLEETSTFSSRFSIAPFLSSIAVSFGSLSAAEIYETNDVWFPLSAVCWC